MKLSIALNLLQLTVVCLLLITVISMDNRLQQQLPASSSIAQPAVNTPAAVSNADALPSKAQQTSGTPPPTLKQIQNMIRQELAPLVSAPAAIQQTALTDPQILLEQELQFDLVDQELDFYIKQGAISDQEMSHLQLEIAKLGPAGKKQAMSLLVKAINAGQLEGRL